MRPGAGDERRGNRRRRRDRRNLRESEVRLYEKTARNRALRQGLEDADGAGFDGCSQLFEFSWELL